MAEELISIDDPADASISREPNADDAQPVKKDGLLNLLVHFTKLGVEPTMTLYCHGIGFTGRMISTKRYLELSHRLVSEPATAYSQIFEAFLQNVDDIALDDDAPTPDYNHVHLCDARAITPGQQGMPAEGTLFRIDRHQVVAWSLGEIR